jgi:hypothetical protein
MIFNDPVHGELVVPDTFVSDLASIRILREICRWCAITALTGGALVDSHPWTCMTCCTPRGSYPGASAMPSITGH